MSLQLYMLGLIVQDMSRALEFYRRLGLAIPEGSEAASHVEIKMGDSLTVFLDSRPSLWDPGFVPHEQAERTAASGSYPMILEFYLKQRAAVDAKYQELTGFGYHGYRAPYATSFGMYFAMVNDPDGNTILLSGDVADHETTTG
jgi:predicted lactoylglutathione lyase